MGKYAETNENSALHVVDRLITNADLVTIQCILLNTDNWYTTIPLVKYLYET